MQVNRAKVTGLWDTINLGSVATIEVGGTPSTAVPTYWGGDIPWMSSGDVHQRRVTDVPGRITAVGLRASNAKIISSPAVAIALAGQGKTRETAALTLKPLCTNQSVALIRGHEAVLDNSYLFHALDARYEDLRAWSAGGGRAGLSKGLLQAVTLSIPPLPEQRRIAEILDTANTAISEMEASIFKLKQMKTGLMHDLLTSGLDERDQLRDPDAHPEQFKDSLLGWIPREWEIGRLEDYYAVPARNGLYKSAAFYGTGPLMIHMPQMFRDLTIDVSEAARVQVSSVELDRYGLRSGDLVFARRSLNLEGAGKCSLVSELPGPTTFESSIIRVRLDSQRLRPTFTNYFLNSEMGFGIRLPFIRQVAVSGVSSRDVASFPVPCPPVQEQDSIIEILDAHDACIRAEEAYRDKLKLQKKGLMDDLLTGRVRVKTAQEIGA